jgi:peptide/nickel transport system substrate-binding protein
MTKTWTPRAALIGAFALLAASPALAQSTLRIAITSSEIPHTTGAPSQGFEGIRFTGYTIYDALINWDLSSADKAAELKPGLAVSWSIDPNDSKTWNFKLRDGVKFHDGSDFDADAVVWNLDKLFNKAAPHHDPHQRTQVQGIIPPLESWKKIDRLTVAITRVQPDAFFPYSAVYLFMSSPAQYERVGRDWSKFAAQASGTGPWKLIKLQPRESAELARNEAYWDKARIPQTERLILRPIPDANARVAALRAGQVDWIENPSPDTIPSLKGAGFRIVTNVYPHVWLWQLNLNPGSPFADVRVRRAANLAINRKDMVELLGGMMGIPKGHVTPNSPWFGKPKFVLDHRPDEAKRLMAEAGFSKEKPLAIKVLMSPSGSGTMQPMPMNEFIQQSLEAVGFKVTYEVMDWGALRNRWRAGAHGPANAGIDAININLAVSDPFLGLTRVVNSKLVAPRGINWGGVSDPEFDKLIAQAQETFDPAKRDALLSRIHEKMVDDAVFLWGAHDVGPRAMSRAVEGFVQAQSWFQDFSPVRVNPTN